MSERTFHCTEGGANKFWVVEQDDGVLRIRWGKLGTQGQSQEKVFANAAAATKELNKLVAEKTKKGYLEVSSESDAQAPKPDSDAQAPKPDSAAGAPALGGLSDLRPDASASELAKALEGLAASAVSSPEGIDLLVTLLAAHEALHGVSDAHRVASEAVAAHLSLVHPFAHDAEITAAALSPSGRWLATGNEFLLNDDSDKAYQRGGVVGIWDVVMGRCVNVLGRIEGGVGSGEEEARALAWHQSEERLGASTGTHGVACLDPFGAGTGIVSSISEGQIKGAAFDGISPSWCWLPGTHDVVLAKYVVSLDAKKGKLRKTIDDERCDFRHRVCAYDGVVTDGHFTVRADSLKPTDARPFRDARMGFALADLSVTEGVVKFTSPSGKAVTLSANARVVRIDNGLVTVSVSPDGRDVAVLTAEGRVELFSNEGAPVSGLAAPWAQGIMRGAAEVLVLLAPDRIAFVDLETSKTLGDFTQLRELSPHPLGSDEAAREQAFVYDPAFALGSGEGWALALPSGDVAAAASEHALLDGTLSLSLGRRRAWPLRWAHGTSAAIRLTTSVADLADKLPARLRAGAKKAAKKPGTAKSPGSAKKAGRGAPAFELMPATVHDVLDYAGALLEAAPPRDAAFAGELLAVGEAAAGRGDQAVRFFERALAARPEGNHILLGSTACSAAFAADLLARAGAPETDNVSRLASSVLAVPASEFSGTPELYAGTLAHLARAYDRVGNTDRADELLEQALASAPSWLVEPRPHAPLLTNGAEAALVAKMLLARGQTDKAFRIFANLGGGSEVVDALHAAAERGDRDTLLRLGASYRTLSQDHEQACALLLKAGHLDLFDVFAPAVFETPYVAVSVKRELALSRHVAHALAVRTKAAFDALEKEATTLLASMTEAPAQEVGARLLAVGAALDACRDKGLDDTARALAEALSAASAGVPADRFAGEAHPSVWKAVAALERAGGDITALLERATTPLARMLAVIFVLPSASKGKAATVAVAKAIDLSGVPAKLAGSLAAAATALANAGEAVLAEAFFDSAVQAAASDYYTLGSVAGSQMRAGDFEGAWVTVQRASKSKRDLAVADYLNVAASLGHASAVLAAARLTSPAERQRVVMAARSLAKVPFNAA